MRITRDNLVFRMDKENDYVLKANSGDEIVFETCDCFSDSIKSEKDLVSGIDFDKVNPATGPLYIEEAEIGDCLKVEIIDIKLNNSGAIVTAPGLGRLADRIDSEETVICEIKNNEVDYLGRNLPLNPMIGVIGTAPSGEGISTGTPYHHGGNMDCTMVKKGSTVYFPVNTKGALLAMGDLHASMGDGEIMGSGIEISGEVRVRVEVLKEYDILPIMIETEDKWITIGSEKTMEEASKIAIDNMVNFIVKKTKLSINQAGMLLSAVGNLRVCQIVDPNMTMRMEIEKKYL
ncbi:MAG: acetamidase/formamidase family protein [Andreesenia angusta]|nr:acetamidase/formamidase family protein [Andreesenia angusta]